MDGEVRAAVSLMLSCTSGSVKSRDVSWGFRLQPDSFAMICDALQEGAAFGRPALRPDRCVCCPRHGNRAAADAFG